MTTPATTGTRRSRRITWVLLGGFVVIIVVGVALASRFGEDPGLVASPLIGEPVPDVTLQLLEEDGEVRLADGDGVIRVVNFWASWCVPCRQEHPALVSTAAAYEGLGVEFVGISYQDRPEDAIRFLDEFGRGYTYTRDDGSRAALEFGVFGVPETFFVDRDGIVVGKIAGAADAALLSSTLDRILVGEAVGSVESGPVQSER
jgi:cytochrome c biogenesis protein CcmG/thiol:disulfide interchange protein DsbE